MTRRHLNPERLHIQTPCSERWEEMQGSAQVRFCTRCEKRVFDLSAMTEAEAEALLAKKRFGICVRYALRPDGTIVSGACPSAQPKVPRAVAAAAAALIAGGGCEPEQTEEQYWAEVELERDSYERWRAQLEGDLPEDLARLAARLDQLERKHRIAAMTPEEREQLANEMGMLRKQSAVPERVGFRVTKTIAAEIPLHVLTQKVTEGRAELQRCCLKSRPDRGQRVLIDVLVRRGRVRTATVNVAPTSDPPFERCMRHVVERWRFMVASAPSKFSFPFRCE